MQFIFGSRYRIYYLLVLNLNIRYKQIIRSNRRLAIVSDYLLLVEMAVIEAPATFAASQPSALFVPFATAKDGRLRFRLPHKKEKQPKFYLSVKLRLSFGGDGGNRNRVRKLIHTAFSGCSQSFRFPSEVRRLTGLLPR